LCKTFALRAYILLEIDIPFLSFFFIVIFNRNTNYLISRQHRQLRYYTALLQYKGYNIMFLSNIKSSQTFRNIYIYYFSVHTCNIRPSLRIICIKSVGVRYKCARTHTQDLRLLYSMYIVRSMYILIYIYRIRSACKCIYKTTKKINKYVL